MRLIRRALAGAFLALFPMLLVAQTTITSPEQFFGYPMGTDRKMARWDKLIADYQPLEKESGGRMKVINMGPTMQDNPFLMVIITSPKNMANLESIRKNNLTLVNPHSTPEAEIKKIVATGKIVMVQSMSMHATEIGGTQMAPELTYDLLNRKDEDTQRNSRQRGPDRGTVLQSGRRDHGDRLL